MAERQILPGEIYRHFKNKLYQIVAIAYHSETKEKYVVYQALYGDYKNYVRPYDMFISEVDHEKYPMVIQKYRFEKVEPKHIEDAESDSYDAPGKVQWVNPAAGASGAAPDGVDPLLIGFLDKDNSKDRIEYLKLNRAKIDDKLINDIAASLDITINEGDIDSRYSSLLSCLSTMARFETGRLR